MKQEKLNMTTLLTGVFLISTFVQLIQCEPFFWAENVCNKTVTVRKQILVDEPVKYEVKYQGMCGMSECTKTRTETRMDSKFRTILKDIQIPYCCAGFVETKDRQCEAIVETLSNEILTGPASAKLEALNARVIDGDLIEVESTKSVSSLISAHMGINLFLILSTIILAMAAFWYKKRLNQIKNELYYAYTRQAPSENSSSSSCDYSSNPPSNYIQDRPRMPLPMDSNFLGKNLNFDSATRNILKGSSNLMNQSKERSTFLYDPKVESHLISSQKSSQQNVYSEIDSNLGDRTLSVCTDTSMAQEKEDNTYQVPKSPSHIVLRQVLLDDTREQEKDDNESNIYEEIKPKSSK